MSCQSSGGRAFHTLGPAAEKLFFVYLTHMSVYRSGNMVYSCVNRSGVTVVNAVLGVFARLSAWWGSNTASVESKMMSLTLLVKLILVDSTVLCI